MRKLPIIRYWPRDLVIKTVVLITCQKFAGAASIYYLGKTGQSLTSFYEILIVLSLFFVFSLLESFLVVPIRRLEVDSYISIYDRILHRKLLGIKNSNIWSNKSKKSEFMTSIGLQLYSSASRLTSSIREIFSFTLGFIFNALVFGFVLDFKFSIAFVASGVLTLIIHFLTKRKIAIKADENKKKEVKYFEKINRGWDNAILDNPGVNQLYNQKYKMVKEGFLHSTKDLFSYSELIVFLSAVASWMPIIIVNLWIMFSYQNDLTVLVSIIVLLPKQVQIINNIRVMSQFLTFLKIDKSSFDSIWQLIKLSPIDLTERINYSKIKINHLPITGFKDVQEIVESNKNGRFTITGENGSGKSSLLALIKNNIEEAFLLPTSPNLEIGIESDAMSFGQRLKSHLAYLSKIDSAVVLLDEWDANLDTNAKSKLSDQISKMALNRMVFEVRH